MGVRGLATYFGNRDLFFDQVKFWFCSIDFWTVETQVELKNCKVIIDGNNLRFALYKWCPGLNHCFGGDYDKYARYSKYPFRSTMTWRFYFNRYVRQFIKKLQRSGIRPIVVFDGGHDKSDQKLATVITRMTEQSRNAVACTSVTQVWIHWHSWQASMICGDVRASCKCSPCLAERSSKRFWKSLKLRWL